MSKLKSKVALVTGASKGIGAYKLPAILIESGIEADDPWKPTPKDDLFMRPGRVQSKVALVTGAGSGIGKATAILLASEGATVLIADISTNAARAVVNEIVAKGERAEALLLDVTDEVNWQQAIEQAIKNHQQPSVCGDGRSEFVAEVLHRRRGRLVDFLSGSGRVLTPDRHGGHAGSRA